MPSTPLEACRTIQDEPQLIVIHCVLMHTQEGQASGAIHGQLPHKATPCVVAPKTCPASPVLTCIPIRLVQEAVSRRRARLQSRMAAEKCVAIRAH
eukprot:14263885-Alexandrium_andersonii.AAC.1